MRIPRLHLPLSCLLVAAAAPSSLLGQISIQVTIGPPPIPVYEQPPLTEEGYVWSPGYWAWGEDGYFWVPGTWVEAPERGLMWTPGYWGWSGEYFEFHRGYWGAHVGYYGGINYGHGYGGDGFEGGYWQGRDYYYNRSVTNVSNVHVTNVYNQTVIVNNTYIAYNGGAGGVSARPSEWERVVERETHVQPTTQQFQQHQVASQNKELLASVNRGKPSVAATARPADFSPRSVVPARAPGGQVDEATIKATPKTMPVPVKAVPESPEGRPLPKPMEPRRGTPPEPSQRPAPDPRLPDRPQSPAPHPTPEPQRDLTPHAAPAPPPVPEPQREPARRPAPRPDAPPAERPAPERPSAERRPEADRQPAPVPRPVREPKPRSEPKPDQKPEPAHEKDKG